MIALDYWTLAALIQAAFLGLIGFSVAEARRRALLEEFEALQRQVEDEDAVEQVAPPPPPAPSIPPPVPFEAAPIPRPFEPKVPSEPPLPSEPPAPIPVAPPPPPPPPPPPAPYLLEPADTEALLAAHVFGPTPDELAQLEDLVESTAQKLSREQKAVKKAVGSLEALVSSFGTLAASTAAVIESGGAPEPVVQELNRIATGMTEAEHTLSDATSSAQDVEDSLGAMARAVEPYTKNGGYSWGVSVDGAHTAVNQKIMARARIAKPAAIEPEAAPPEPVTAPEAIETSAPLEIEGESALDPASF
ncbi:MAG: hypothetical protein U1E65_04205 [Myxococcota bacterium]